MIRSATLSQCAPGLGGGGSAQSQRARSRGAAKTKGLWGGRRQNTLVIFVAALVRALPECPWLVVDAAG